ncbi:MAG: DNA polymerase III subunit delta' [Deltaproteobacteria bacterium]
MSFKEIIGHKDAIGFLAAAYAGDRLAHAYLFVGPAGIGKGRVARAFARLLLCESPREGAACGMCGGCRRSGSGQHPDLRILEPDGPFIRIDAVRAAGDFVNLKPFEAARKVLIIDPASAMNEEAANALLKTLEEPAAHTIIVLIAETAAALPGTIVSRCQRLVFGALASAELEALLVGRLGLDRTAARDLGRLCDGSPGEALRFHQEGVLEQRDALLRFLDSDAPMKEANAWTADRETALRLLRALAMWYRDMLTIKVTDAPDLLAAASGAAALRNAAGGRTVKDILSALGVVAQTSLDIRRNANMRLAFEQMRTQLCTSSFR